jgi:hypothetical protein
MTALLLTGLLLAQTPAATPPPPPAPTLSALHQAQAEAHLAKLRVLQLEVQLRQQALAEERARLEQALAAAHPGYRMDWERGQLVAQPAEPPR